jgi:hypothetical protein
LEGQEIEAEKIEVVPEAPAKHSMPAIVSTEEAASEMSESTRRAIVVDESIWITALRRCIALAIDSLCLTILLLIPTFFLALASPGFELTYDAVLDFSHAIARQGAPAAIGQLLLLTPIPLIYLRVTFKYFHGWNTPGEAITGLSSRSSMPGLAGLAHESFYGLLQYAGLLFCCMFGLIGPFLAVFVLFFVFGLGLRPLSYDFVLPLLIVLWSLTTALFLTIAYLPKSKTDLTSSIDAACGHLVERLGRESSIPAIAVD